MPGAVLGVRGRKNQGEARYGMRGYFAMLREKKKIRPEDIASRWVLSMSTVSGWRSGRVRPDLVTIAALEHEFKIPVFFDRTPYQVKKVA